MVDTRVTKQLDKNLLLLATHLKSNHTNPFLAEQYKLLIDASQKSEERKKDTHSFFITINSIFLPLLIKVYKIEQDNLRDFIVLALLIGLGMILCIDWIMIIKTYKNMNYINYSMTRAFEEYMPTPVFSLRDAVLEPGFEYERANVLAQKEMLIPYFFLITYTIYFCTTILPFLF